MGVNTYCDEPMPPKLFDTYTRETREFKPLEGNRVRVYCCGSTV